MNTSSTALHDILEMKRQELLGIADELRALAEELFKIARENDIGQRCEVLNETYVLGHLAERMANEI